MSFDFLPAGIEDAQFKRTPDGWVYTTLSPWIFAPRRSYLVSDEVKPALAARVRRGQYLQMLTILPIILLLGVLFGIYPQILKQALAVQLLAFAAFVVAIVATIALTNYFAVRPIVKDLPRTGGGLRYFEHFSRQGEVLSVKVLALITALFAFGAVSQFHSALTSRVANTFSVIGGIAMAVLTIVYACLLIRRMRADRGTTT